MHKIFARTFAVALVAALATACAPQSNPALEAKVAELREKVAEFEASAKLAKDNMALMEKYDMVAWNNKDSAMLASLHHPDLKADINGKIKTDFAQFMKMSSDNFKGKYFPKIISQEVKLAQGDWTAVIENYETALLNGEIAKGSLATFAKWKDGKVIAEYEIVDQSGEPSVAKKKSL